jgi:hypothetical protein
MAESRIVTLKEMHLTTDLREGSEIVALLSAGGVTALAGLPLADGPGLLAGTDRGVITALSRA